MNDDEAFMTAWIRNEHETVVAYSKDEVQFRGKVPMIRRRGSNNMVIPDGWHLPEGTVTNTISEDARTIIMNYLSMGGQ